MPGQISTEAQSVLDWILPWLPLLNFIFDEILVLIIAYVLLLKGLNIKRLTPLGRAMSDNNLLFSLGYFTAFLGGFAVLAVFMAEPVRWLIRVFILVSILRVLIEMKWVYGGWRALHRRAWHSARDRLLNRTPSYDEDDEGY